MAHWLSRGLMVWLVWAAGAAYPALSSDALTHADDSLVLGIFAYRNADVIRARYQPLADYLDAQLPDIRVTLETLSLAEIESAISHRQIDLLMTNPSHYLQVRSRNHLTGALATQVRLEGGEEVSSLGGVVVTLAERRDLDTLRDLEGHRVGIPGKSFLGGYQTQAFEFAQMGMSPERDLDLIELGSHDAVISALQAGQVEAGFVRTGILENLSAEGTIDLARFKVLNRQQLAEFPFAVSTRLYPEWPIIALPQVERGTIQRLSAALFSLTPDHEAARAATIAGFAPPMDYLAVENLARELRQPPFDQAQQVSWRDIWDQHRPYLVALMGSLTAVLVLLVLLSRRNHKLAQQRSQLRLSASVFSHTQEGIMITSPSGQIIEVNPTFTQLTGYTREEVIGEPASLLGAGQHDDATFASLWEALRDEGEWDGELINRHKSGQVYPVRLRISAIFDGRGRLQRYVGLMRDITELKAHQQELEFIAFYDSLTGLPNRTLLADRMHKAMSLSRRHHHHMALAFIDLDGFKAVNDTYGHDMGDKLLVELAGRMSSSLRESDTLARLGGDEFVAVLVELNSDEECLPVLDRLLEVVAMPVLIDGVTLEVSASLGVAFYPTAEELDADQLLRHADQAMYHAKRQGKNRYTCFDPSADVDEPSATSPLPDGCSPSV